MGINPSVTSEERNGKLSGKFLKILLKAPSINLILGAIVMKNYNHHTDADTI